MGNRHFCVILLGLMFLRAPALGETKVFFSSQDHVEEKMTHLIDDSRSSIDIALFELRSPGLTRALNRAEGRGVLIRLVLDASHRQDDLFAGEVRWLGGKHSGGHGVMHNKFALFDQSQVVTGSYNWTPGAEHANYENALLTDDPDVVHPYAREFELLWRRAVESTRPHPPRFGRSGHKKPSRHRASKSVRIRVLRSAPPRL